MYPIPQSEKLIETKVCKQCQASFPITDKDLEFYDKVSPIFDGKKYLIPTPTLCPDCGQQRRLAFRNERKLYKRNCDATGKSIISIYSPDKPYKIYHQDYWWSDAWNPIDFGQDVDFSRSFFSQMGQLELKVPLISLIVKNAENSEYTNYTSNHKNCYLTIGGEDSEDCMYGNYQFYTNNCSDFYWLTRCDYCYEVQKCIDCRELYYSRDCTAVNESFFCVNCNGLDHCIGCWNLSNKSYHIFNKPVTKEEYEKTKLLLSNRADFDTLQKKVNEFFSHRIVKYADITKSENCTGDIIVNSKDCFNCNSLEGGDEGKNVTLGYGFSRAYDSTLIGFSSDNVIGGLGIMEGHGVYYSTYLWGGNSKVFYSMHCYNNNSNLFGCIGLRNKQYCILNKQYTKEEYESLVPKIIEHMQKTGEWGEFFPASLSPFGYNETVANEYFPLTKEEILGTSFVKEVSTKETEDFGNKSPALQAPSLQRGLYFNWSDYEAPFPKVEKIIPASKLPDDITKIPDDILNWAVECEVTGKPFRIIKQELEFYRKHNLPIPRRHPDQRHKDRMELRNPRKLFERICDKCKKDILTTYAPERSEIVYCEECYNKEVI